MLLARSGIGALGVLVAAMALAALAVRDRAPALDSGSATAPQRAARPVAGSALSALRDGAKVELNRAQAADLELLPGIGPQLAARIVAHRRRHGPFRSCDELRQVHGIGPRTVERLRPLLDVAAGQGAPPDAGEGPPPPRHSSQITPASTVR